MSDLISKREKLPSTIILKGEGIQPVVGKGFLHTEHEERAIIHIPEDLRHALGIKPGDLVPIEANGYVMDVEVQGARPNDVGQFLVRLNKIARLALGVNLGDRIKIYVHETLVLVIDISSSMLEHINEESKIKATQHACHHLIENKVGSKVKIGVVVYTTEAYLLASPTTDYKKLSDKIYTIHAGGGTCLDQGMRLANSVLEEVRGLKRVIDLTDGGTEEKPALDIAYQAKTLGIVHDTIGVGRKGEFNEALLREIARITGGTYRYCYDLKKLRREFQNLSNEKKLPPLLLGKQHLQLDT
jgi:hypothetical protein